MKGYTVFVLVAAILLLSYLIYSFIQTNGGLGHEQVAELLLVYGNGSTTHVNAYVASSLTQWETGLMYRQSMGSCEGLGDCYGMLFVFPNASDECFWMKNTEIPLKQLWITSNLVTAQVNGAPYSTASYCNFGNWVLEVYPNSSLGPGGKVYLERVLK